MIENQRRLKQLRQFYKKHSKHKLTATSVTTSKQSLFLEYRHFAANKAIPNFSELYLDFKSAREFVKEMLYACGEYKKLVKDAKLRHIDSDEWIFSILNCLLNDKYEMSYSSFDEVLDLEAWHTIIDDVKKQGREYRKFTKSHMLSEISAKKMRKERKKHKKKGKHKRNGKKRIDDSSDPTGGESDKDSNTNEKESTDEEEEEESWGCEVSSESSANEELASIITDSRDRNTSKDNENKVFTASDIATLRSKYVNRVMDVLSVEQSMAETLLSSYLWDFDKLMTTYFENPDEVLKITRLSEIKQYFKQLD